MTRVIRAGATDPLRTAVATAITERGVPQLARETDLAARTLRSFAAGARVIRPTLGKLALWARRHAPAVELDAHLAAELEAALESGWNERARLR